MANTATPNQPLIKHPLPWAMHRNLGAGSTLLTGILPNSDTLVIPPPPSSPNGRVVRVCDVLTSVTIINNTLVGIAAAVPPAINFRLVYKNANGEEAFVADDDNALAAGGTVTLEPENVILSDEDQEDLLRVGDLQEELPPVPP